MFTNRKKIKPVKITLSTHNYIDGYGGADIWLTWSKKSRKHGKRRYLGPCFHVKQGSVQGIEVNEKMITSYKAEELDPSYSYSKKRYSTHKEMIEMLQEEIREDEAILKQLESQYYIFQPNQMQKGVSEVYMRDDFLTIKAAERCIKWLLKTHYHLLVVTLKWEKKPTQRKYWTPEWDEANWQKQFN